jgi:transposase
MTNERVKIITSVERRRGWTLAEKEELVASSLEPGASASAIAREAGIHASQLYGWRRQLGARQVNGFAPVEIGREPAPAGVAGRSAIEFASGARIRIMGAVDPATLRGGGHSAIRWTAPMIPPSGEPDTPQDPSL